jgi:hypothetical protein
MGLPKYFIFLIFNHYYRDGNYKEIEVPYFTAAASIAVYESFILIVAMHFIKNYINFALPFNLLSSLDGIIYGRGMLILALIYPVNHYFLITKNRFDRIYNEFKNAKMNTKKNRIIGYICLILYWPIMVGIIGHLKYWFP